MRLIVQRVKWARVLVERRVAGEIENGFMILAGFSSTDHDHLDKRVWDTMLDKLLGLRVFADDQGKMNVSLKDVQGGILLVPQFTLYADCRKGRRPGFSGSAPFEQARPLFYRLALDIKQRYSGVELGVFGEEMEVELNNHGPVTIILDSDDFQ